jgi:hypothetical protein
MKQFFCSTQGSVTFYRCLCVRYNLVFFMLGWSCILNYMNNNQHDALLSSFYWVITPLHVSAISTAHHQKVECIHVANGTCYTSELTVSRLDQARWQSTHKYVYNKYHLPHIHILPSDDGPLIRPKHVEVWQLNKLKIYSASCWLLFIYYSCVWCNSDYI